MKAPFLFQKYLIAAALFSCIFGCRSTDYLASMSTGLKPSFPAGVKAVTKPLSTFRPSHALTVSSNEENALLQPINFQQEINTIAETTVSESDKTAERSNDHVALVESFLEARDSRNVNVSPESTRIGESYSEVRNSSSFNLTLDDAITLGLEQNPDLAVVRASMPVAVAAKGVADTYIFNPQVQTQVLPYSRDSNGNDGAISQQHVLVQSFEFGGQQNHREGVAAASLRQVQDTIRQAELTNASQTTGLFFTALYQRELRNLTFALAELNQTQIGVVERRVEAGLANPTDVNLAQLQSQASRRQLRLAETTYQTALLALQNQLNLTGDVELKLSGNWTDWQWRSIHDLIAPNDGDVARVSRQTADRPMAALTDHPSDPKEFSPDDESLRQLIIHRPDVQAARWAVEATRENLRLADGMRKPNLQAGPLYQRDASSETYWGLQAQFDIPVVNSGRPLVQQRIAELQQQQVTASQLENRAVFEARAALIRYQRARQMLEQSRVEFKRDLSASLEPFEAQFKAGQITLLQVYAARTTLVQSQQSFYDQLNEMALAVANVVQTTGILPFDLILYAE